MFGDILKQQTSLFSESAGEFSVSDPAVVCGVMSFMDRRGEFVERWM